MHTGRITIKKIEKKRVVYWSGRTVRREDWKWDG